MNNTLYSKRWLVVDDDPVVLKLIAKVLQSLPEVEIVACDNPQQALEVFEDDPESFEILVTDFDMPGINGLELAGRARAQSPGLHVLMISGSSFNDADLRRAGLDGFLAKPCLPDDLLKAVLAVCRGQSRHGETRKIAIVHE